MHIFWMFNGVREFLSSRFGAEQWNREIGIFVSQVSDSLFSSWVDENNESDIRIGSWRCEIRYSRKKRNLQYKLIASIHKQPILQSVIKGVYSVQFSPDDFANAIRQILVPSLVSVRHFIDARIIKRRIKFALIYLIIVHFLH